MDALRDKMIADAEKFLLICITKHDVDTFDELRLLSIDNKSTMRNICSLTLNAFCQLLLTSGSIYCAHICSVTYGYTLLFSKTLTCIHLNMLID